MFQISKIVKKTMKMFTLINKHIYIMQILNHPVYHLLMIERIITSIHNLFRFGVQHLCDAIYPLINIGQKRAIVRNNNFQVFIIGSVAKEQAALVNAEDAKIQRLAAMFNVTSVQLLCLNQSVSVMMDSIALLEAVLKQKLSITGCQINGQIC